ncbi:hypothetical protein ACROYT_G003592 [Oculina patagonica]
MFADDTNLIISGKNYFELQNGTNHDLENIRQWLLGNKLSLNTTKTEFLIIGSNYNLANLGYSPEIRACAECRVPDAIQVDWRAAEVPSGGELKIYDTSRHSFNSLIERNRKTVRHRKMYRNNLIDDDVEFFTERGYLVPIAGDECRVPDAIQVDWRAEGVPSGGELEIYDTSRHSLNNSLIERNRKTFRHRKMYRNNLIDDDEEFFRERGYLVPMKPRETAYQNQILVNSKPVHYDEKHKPKHKKRHKHRKRQNLSAIFEEEDQDGRTSPTIEETVPTIEETVGKIPSSEDDEPGITFEAKHRGRLGRYASFENQPSKDSAPEEPTSEDTES